MTNPKDADADVTNHKPPRARWGKLEAPRIIIDGYGFRLSVREAMEFVRASPRMAGPWLDFDSVPTIWSSASGAVGAYRLNVEGEEAAAVLEGFDKDQWWWETRGIRSLGEIRTLMDREWPSGRPGSTWKLATSFQEAKRLCDEELVEAGWLLDNEAEDVERAWRARKMPEGWPTTALSKDDLLSRVDDEGRDAIAKLVVAIKTTVLPACTCDMRRALICYHRDGADKRGLGLMCERLHEWIHLEMAFTRRGSTWRMAALVALGEALYGEGAGPYLLEIGPPLSVDEQTWHVRLVSAKLAESTPDTLGCRTGIGYSVDEAINDLFHTFDESLRRVGAEEELWAEMGQALDEIAAAQAKAKAEEAKQTGADAPKED